MGVEQAGQIVCLVRGDDEERLGRGVSEVAKESLCPLTLTGVLQFRWFATGLDQTGDSGTEPSANAIEHVPPALIFRSVMQQGSNGLILVATVLQCLSADCEQM